jgi:hypothetical protein
MAKGPTLLKLAARFSSMSRKQLDDTWGAISRKRDKLMNTSFKGRSDPRNKAVGRLAKASKAVTDAQKDKLNLLEKAHKQGAPGKNLDEIEKNLAVETGPKGGRYYVSPSGEKVYVK